MKTYTLKLTITEEVANKIDAICNKLECDPSEVLARSLGYYNLLATEKIKDPRLKLIMLTSKGERKEITLKELIKNER